MKAFHTNWTLPFFAPGGKTREQYGIYDFDILTTILSALKWRSLNGSIKLYTDEAGAEYYDRLGISAIWDLGIDTQVLEKQGGDINPMIFWAAGKLLALENEDVPCVMLDTDLIVWENIGYRLNTEAAVIHREDLMEGVYIPMECLNTPPGYSFNNNWSWKEKACNTAFAYFGSSELKSRYTYEALRFIRNNTMGIRGTNNESLTLMVFSEQRLLPMCAKEMGISIDEILTSECFDDQDIFTHVWGYKNVLKNDEVARESFCICAIHKILKNFPEWAGMLYKIKTLERYFSKITT